ncbi:hypothetical protein D9M68_889790 [compost metagenome]
MNDLDRLLTFLAEGSTQGFVTGNQGLEAAPQRFDIQPPFQSQRRRDVISRAPRLQLPQEPLTLLGVGEH